MNHHEPRPCFVDVRIDETSSTIEATFAEIAPHGWRGQPRTNYTYRYWPDPEENIDLLLEKFDNGTLYNAVIRGRRRSRRLR